MRAALPRLIVALAALPGHGGACISDSDCGTSGNPVHMAVCELGGCESMFHCASNNVTLLDRSCASGGYRDTYLEQLYTQDEDPDLPLIAFHCHAGEYIRIDGNHALDWLGRVTGVAVRRGAGYNTGGNYVMSGVCPQRESPAFLLPLSPRATASLVRLCSPVLC